MDTSFVNNKQSGVGYSTSVILTTVRPENQRLFVRDSATHYLLRRTLDTLDHPPISGIVVVGYYHTADPHATQDAADEQKGVSDIKDETKSDAANAAAGSWRRCRKSRACLLALILALAAILTANAIFQNLFSNSMWNCDSNSHLWSQWLSLQRDPPPPI